MRIVVWKVVDSLHIDQYRKSGHTVFVPELPGVVGPGYGPPPGVGTPSVEATAEKPAPKARFSSRYVSRIRRRANGKMELTPELRSAMSNLRKRGWTYVSIGKKYGVTSGRCWQIINQGK